MAVTHQPLKVGFDFGTNTSVICGDEEEREVKLKQEVITTVVGYAKPTVLPGVLPNNRKIFYGDEARDLRRYLDLRWPLEKGIVKDMEAARDFVAFVRSLVNCNGREVWCVIGSPARTDTRDLEVLREAMGSQFARFLIVPEPFMAALGVREEEKLNDPKYLDPVKNSIIVDIGAGTTDLCVLQGFYPTANDQICYQKAGNDIDLFLRQLIERKYPDAKLHNVSVTRLKEENAYVGSPKKKMTLDVMIHGKQRTLDVTELVGQACEIIVPDIVQGILELAKRCDQEITELILQNILLTGGGSMIEGLSEVVEKKLHERGLVQARVRRASDYKKLVAIGGTKVGRMVRDDQWQHPSLS